ncbi:unnamed protein product [Orchesella dallaii]|uniref:Uncharacterized protein n=1 Tax=Orchesella dallaii TaxID=48710 RepID=A0ABP1Q3K0_9HEXA
MISVKRDASFQFLVITIILVGNVVQVAHGINIPFFGPLMSSSKPAPATQRLEEQKEARIINADHGQVGGIASNIAGGNTGPTPWVSGTRDQYIRDQLVVLHPDSNLNRELWWESGYLNPEYNGNARVVPIKPRNHPTTKNPAHVRKVYRKSKQQPPVTKGLETNIETPGEHLDLSSNSNVAPQSTHYHQELPPLLFRDESGQLLTTGGGPNSPSPYSNSFFPQAYPGFGFLGDGSQPLLFRDDINSAPEGPKSSDSNVAPQQVYQNYGGHGDAMPPLLYRDGGSIMNTDAGESSSSLFSMQDPVFHRMIPPYYPFRPRATSQTLPPEAIIQFLKSPEQELNPMTRPQIKLPFPLRHDCSSGGSGGNKPLQFVVLPIVEPVAPLKPVLPPKPFLTSQYGQFPYIPPFNLFNKYPLGSQSNIGDNVQSSGGGSGQFVPFLNRPAPPLPFVFVQSLPLELIGQNMEMDVLHASSASSDNKVEKPPTAPPSKPNSENKPQSTRPLPLIVIEKVKNPGAPPPLMPSSLLAPPGVSPAAAVEITKQSVQKDKASPPVSTISVVQPIGAPGSQHAEELNKAIEKLVPVAAAVLENVEKQQKEEKENRENKNVKPVNSIKDGVKVSAPLKVPEKNVNPVIPGTPTRTEQEKTPLRPPLRPDVNEARISTGKVVHKKPDSSSSEEVGSTTISEVEVTEA